MVCEDAAGPKFETLEALLDVNYTWGYADVRRELRDLYDKAQKSQWVANDVLDFSRDVDPTRRLASEELHPLWGSELYGRITPKEHERLNHEMSSWMLSQFLHGEQGALLAAAQLAQGVPDLDSKLYSGTQVMDEARHVDVFNRYLQHKIGMIYPVNPHLKTLLDLILLDSRWDMKLIGMQIMVEGLALAAFAMIRHNAGEPLLVDIMRYVMSDEARHVAFGILALREFYADQPESVRREREDFVFEAARLMRDRFLFQEVWEKLGMPVEQCTKIALDNNGQILFRQLLFAKVVPAIKRIGLLSDSLRTRFADLGILQFESWPDPFDAEIKRATSA
jgi:hypothetical protein